MAFAQRSIVSTIHVFGSTRGYECDNCSLVRRAPSAINPKITSQVPDTSGHFVVSDNFDMIRHLADHMKDGDLVSLYTVWELARAQFDAEVG